MGYSARIFTVLIARTGCRKHFRSARVFFNPCHFLGVRSSAFIDKFQSEGQLLIGVSHALVGLACYRVLGVGRIQQALRRLGTEPLYL